MTTKNDGGLAFPCKAYTGLMQEGLSIRDYFAAKAMHQMMAGAVLPVGYDASPELSLLSERAYEVADAMLAARSAA